MKCMLNETGKCKEGAIGASLANLTVVVCRALRGLRGLRACSHPACAFGGLVCWAAPGWRGCRRLACVTDGHCRRAMRELRNCRRFARVLGGLACWAALGLRGCGRLACMADGHCRQAVRGMRGCQLARMLCGLAAELADELPTSCLRARQSYVLSGAGLADSSVSRLPAWRSLLGDGMLRLSGSVAPCLRGVG